MIDRQTFDFLKDLVKNNNRDWFMANKERHDQAREKVIAFAGDLIKELSKIDPGIETSLDPKKCVMRIYRDIRFSLDKTPYKNNFGIGKLNSGKGILASDYYMHIPPVASFIAGGGWMPENN